MDANRVSVKIYGQDYIVAGDKAREHIIKVADYVNTKMLEIGKENRDIPLSTLGILAAVNIADDYFDAINEANQSKSQTVQLEKDTSHYLQLWEEAKKTIIGYKEDSKTIVDQKKDLQKIIDEQKIEIEKLKENEGDIEAKVAMSSQNLINELENKVREMENSFFDVQMENIQLKSEIERLRRVE